MTIEWSVATKQYKSTEEESRLVDCTIEKLLRTIHYRPKGREGHVRSRLKTVLERYRRELIVPGSDRYVRHSAEAL